jgi:hypothetical protein
MFARVRCLLDQSGIDQVILGEDSHHTVQLLNITPSKSLGNITPREAACGVVPDVSKLRVFGCVAFATLQHPKELEDKAVRATNLRHIGYGKYRLLLPGPDNKIFVATSVKFDEPVFDFAADAVKEVTGIRNITRGDDIISDDMRLLAETMKMKISMPKDPRLCRQSMLKTVTISMAMSKTRRWRRCRKIDATRNGPVHRHRHGILPFTQLRL